MLSESFDKRQATLLQSGPESFASSAHRKLMTLAMKNHIRCSRATRVFAERRVRFETSGADAHSRWNRIEIDEFRTRAFTKYAGGLPSYKHTC